MHFDNYNLHCVISIHALLAESDGFGLAWMAPYAYFYPRSPCGERPIMQNIIFMPRKFLSTLSLRRATFRAQCTVIRKKRFLSTLSLRRATRTGQSKEERAMISIHALLAESDSARGAALPCGSYFYPRSPCGERPRRWPLRSVRMDFYPRSPCGERLTHRGAKLRREYFYPRSPCGERQIVPRITTPKHNFYPRSPCGERLHQLHNLLVVKIISIHALLAESDHRPAAQGYARQSFLSTLSLRRATQRSVGQHGKRLFLSTLSLRRATRCAAVLPAGHSDFYPRSPCGERRRKPCRWL